VLSLRGQLFGLWALLAVSAVVTAYLILQLYQQTAARQISEAEEVAGRACRSIADRYQFYTADSQASSKLRDDNELRQKLTNVVQAALLRISGVEGGIWQSETGSLAYAFPTYEGTGPKTDVPAAELPTIRQVNAEAVSDKAPASRRLVGRAQTLLIHACPLPGALPGLSAWTMTRVFTWAGPAYNRLLLGLGVLGFTVIGSALWLMLVIIGWSRRLNLIQQKLGANNQARLPRLESTGERELDRLVEALNTAGERLAEAHDRVAAAERLAAVGRLSAGLAHEIRNPITAMRLKAENALASDDQSRSAAALHSILEQVGRLNALLSDLLAMTQRHELDARPLDLNAFLQDVAQAHHDFAASKSITIEVRVAQDAGQPCLDGTHLRRALDNLLLNALQVLSPGGHITLSARREASTLRLAVEDDGPGVPPEIEDRLFDPFVSGRADGTGLGLAIVREVARAHGGEVRLVDTLKGSVFEIEVPWQPC
jgi:signal transduction histidine kinase